MPVSFFSVRVFGVRNGIFISTLEEFTTWDIGAGAAASFCRKNVATVLWHFISISLLVG